MYCSCGFLRRSQLFYNFSFRLYFDTLKFYKIFNGIIYGIWPDYNNIDCFWEIMEYGNCDRCGSNKLKTVRHFYWIACGNQRGYKHLAHIVSEMYPYELTITHIDDDGRRQFVPTQFIGISPLWSQDTKLTEIWIYISTPIHHCDNDVVVRHMQTLANTQCGFVTCV